MIGRLLSKLHERILTKHLAKASSPLSNAQLDNLLAGSASIVESIDDLTSSLYAPQDEAVVSGSLRQLRSSVHSLRGPLFDGGPPGSDPASVTPSVEQAMSSLSLAPSPVSTADKNVLWLQACFAQIDKSMDALL